MNPVRLPPRPACEAPSILTALDAHHRTELDALRAMYTALGAMLVEQRVNNGVLKDILAALQQRSPAPSLHDLVAEATGSHRAISTPPLLALGQKAWWKVLVVVLDKSITLAIGASILWLWKALHP